MPLTPPSCTRLPLALVKAVAALAARPPARSFRRAPPVAGLRLPSAVLGRWAFVLVLALFVARDSFLSCSLQTTETYVRETSWMGC